MAAFTVSRRAERGAVNRKPGDRKRFRGKTNRASHFRGLVPTATLGWPLRCRASQPLALDGACSIAKMAQVRGRRESTEKSRFEVSLHQADRLPTTGFFFGAVTAA